MPLRYVSGDRRQSRARRQPVRAIDASRNAFGFVVEGYRPDHELIIDPVIQYSTFLGGSSDDLAGGIAVDQAGNAYIVGTTQSPDFRTTAGAFKRTGATSNFSDVFVTKLNAAGTGLV